MFSYRVIEFTKMLFELSNRQTYEIQVKVSKEHAIQKLVNN